ncbi:MAG TPA: UDP-glucuronic acid decarboxylase family protein [Streptosporangiaceae bacterium]
MRILVTGGAGFVGSHLVAELIARGDQVVCVDNLSTGSRSNLRQLAGQPGFEFVEADITAGISVPGHIDAVAHLASPASPRDYLRLPFQTLAAGSHGTEQALRLADERGARFLLASTSEVYGNPAVHPQREDYWGNVNPVGPRSVYDEAKRFAEALTAAWRREHDLNTGIVRIFNTYGPKMAASDGRVIATFIAQALAGEPLTIFGDGSQTRSFCYVDDLIRGLLAMIDSAMSGPVNLGNPEEHSVIDVASLVLEVTGSTSPITYRPLPADDPVRRRPDIALARQLLGWQPRMALADGLRLTTDWLRSRTRLVPRPGSPS